MTTSNDPELIRAEIAQTRAELSDNVDTLTETANPKNIAHRQVNKVKGAVSSVKDKIMGADDDPSDTGRVGDAKAAAADKMSEAGDSLAAAPRAVKQKTQGNPLAAGLIAFGAGLLISSLIPSTQKEQDAVTGLQDNLEPLKQKASDAAKEITDNLRAPAQEAVEAVKTTATDAVASVKDEGQAAKDQVQAQAVESKATVQDAQSH